MKQMILKAEPFPVEQIPKMLEKYGILINHYAETYFSHPLFSGRQSREMMITITSLQEIGLEKGASLDAVFKHISKIGLKPCPPDTGLFLRLAWTDQPQSQSSILSGTHAAPDRAVTVLSEILESDDAFPKGLYLRNVDGKLWLRGYVCDSEYRFPGDAWFAFEADVNPERSAPK